MRIVKRILLGFVLLSIAGYVFLAYGGSELLDPPRAFDADDWRSADAHGRERMVGDLVRSRLLIGMTRNEVSDVLGAADRDNGTMEYDLGRGGFMDWRGCIQVKFDRNDRVIAVDYFD
jgi:hypothetical protein